VIVGGIGVAIAIMAFGWSDDREEEIPASEIARLEQAQAGMRRAT